MSSVFLDGLSVLSEKWMVVLGAVSVTCLGFGVSFFLSRDSLEEKINPWRSSWLPAFFFVVSVPLRLAFLKHAFVPSYFDSVEHYRVIKELVTALETSTLLETVPALTPGYYHLGFHFLASLLTLGLHTDPIDVILVLGQVVLAALPIPVFYLIQRETHSDAAAFFSMLLAGFGWYMPGFAVNWGKYPALAGLLVLELVLSIAYGIDRKKSGPNQLALAGFLLLGIIVSTLFHTRTLAVIAISVASWLVAGKLSTLPKTFQHLCMGILLTGILVLGKLIQAEPLLNLTLAPYLGDGLPVTIAVLALSPFALVKSPRSFYFSLLFILLVLAALFVPVNIRYPGLENQTVLDRPFVEIVLYLPLSILGGLGFAGLLQKINNIRAIPEKTRSYVRALIAILLVGFAGLILTTRYDFYPSDCCNFVKYDDTVALDWLDRNLPPEAHILIAATQLNVLPAGPSASLVGTDAGIWIPALTGRTVSLAPFDIDFRSTGTLEQLCQKQVGYVYVGGTGQIFNTAQLSEKADWYQRVLFLPNAQLYQLTQCIR
jgi:hypothetical protein